MVAKQLAKIHKMHIVHSCGPYGNDCGTGLSLPSKSAELKSLPKSYHYTAALEAMANSA